MSNKLLQFNSGDHVLGGKNITEAISSDGDIVFNESYIVIGDLLEAVHIHATYDLRVLGDIKAEQITVNGSLFVDGDIESDSLLCRGEFICTGVVRVANVELSSYSVAASMFGEELRAAGDVFVRTTIDTNTLLEVNGLLVAGEGIMGDGKFKAKAAVANEYYEFLGESDSSVFEISAMNFAVRADEPGRDDNPSLDVDNMGIEIAVKIFNKEFTKSIKEWSSKEECEFINSLRSTIANLPDLHSVDEIIDSIIELSYEREISNFRDYLNILYARHVFPDELARYETLAPVLTGMFDAVTFKIDVMEFKTKDIVDFARSIYILSKYHSELPISFEEGADKIFSSIGLRYSTVEHAWRTHNG